VDQIYQVFQVFTLPKCTLADFEETQLLQEQHKCDADITALLQDMTNVLACITDVEQFAKSAQLKQAMEEVNPIVRATGNFITKYSTQSLKCLFHSWFCNSMYLILNDSEDPFHHFWHRDKGRTGQAYQPVSVLQT
jgi:hypothetical protein